MCLACGFYALDAGVWLAHVRKHQREDLPAAPPVVGQSADNLKPAWVSISTGRLYQG